MADYSDAYKPDDYYASINKDARRRTDDVNEIMAERAAAEPPMKLRYELMMMLDSAMGSRDVVARYAALRALDEILTKHGIE